MSNGETERGTEIETKADRERHRGTDIDRLKERQTERWRLREILKYVIELKK